jgi:hypothetical protein
LLNSFLVLQYLIQSQITSFKEMASLTSLFLLIVASFVLLSAVQADNIDVVDIGNGRGGSNVDVVDIQNRGGGGQRYGGGYGGGYGGMGGFGGGYGK